MSQIIEPSTDEILGKEFPCLNHGFVRLVDFMGTDESIVQAARVSYGKGTKKVSQDRGLIRYLMRHQHTTPFEMVEFKFHCKMPLFVARQWIRHRTASINEYSLRYSKAINEFYIPEENTLQPQSQTNKQGRDTMALPQADRQQILEILKTGIESAWTDYEQLDSSGLSRELSRINLPLSIYTEWYWKINLHNLLHFLKLRLDEHAQYEIQIYAQAIAEIVKVIVPISWQAFEDYILNAQLFSKPELSILVKVLQLAESKIEWENLLKDSDLSKREKSEFSTKLTQIKKL